MIHVNDKLALSAHQKLLQHVLTREALNVPGRRNRTRKTTRSYKNAMKYGTHLCKNEDKKISPHCTTHL
jgi:hypothetical protein